MVRLGLAVALAMGLSPGWLQAQTDSVAPLPKPAPLIRGSQAIRFGAALGVALVADQTVRRFMQDHRGTGSARFAQAGNAFGEPRFVVPVLALGYLGGALAGSPSIQRAVANAAMAVAVGSGVDQILKIASGRGRPSQLGDFDYFKPFSVRYVSFPSGHTTVAFAMASSFARETRSVPLKIGLYGAASLTALARVHDDRHWLSDVVAGAGLGYLAAAWTGRRDLGRHLVLAPGRVGVQLAF